MVSLKKHVVAATAMFAAMGMALAGCGSSSNTTEQKAADPNEKVEITYIHRLPDSKGMTLVNDIVARWNAKHPNIQVKAQKFNGKPAELLKKLETDVKAGNAPDLAQVGYGELPEAYTKGILQDVSQEASKYAKDFSESSFKLMKVGDKTFGLPQDTGPLVYYYNKDAFAKLGLSVPKTQAEFIETAKKAAAQGKFIADFESDEVGYMFSGLAGASGPWYNVEGNAWKVNTATKGSTAVADVFQQLLDAKAVDLKPRWDPSFDKALQDGSLIGTIGAAWEAPLIKDSVGDTGKGQWQVAQLGNWFENAGKTGPDGGSGVVALKGSKHAAQAMEFLDWFNTQVEDLTSQGLVVAATTSAAKTPQDLSDYFGGQDLMKEYATANQNMGEFTYIPGFSAVTSAMVESASKAADGSGKVSDIFSTAQKSSLDTLKSYGLSVAQ